MAKSLIVLYNSCMVPFLLFFWHIPDRWVQFPRSPLYRPPLRRLRHQCWQRLADCHSSGSRLLSQQNSQQDSTQLFLDALPRVFLVNALKIERLTGHQIYLHCLTIFAARNVHIKVEMKRWPLLSRPPAAAWTRNSNLLNSCCWLE